MKLHLVPRRGHCFRTRTAATSVLLSVSYYITTVALPNISSRCGKGTRRAAYQGLDLGQVCQTLRVRKQSFQDLNFLPEINS